MPSCSLHDGAAVGRIGHFKPGGTVRLLSLTVTLAIAPSGGAFDGRAVRAEDTLFDNG
jgi:hypothetical protein